jgi:hypothetical protein
VATIRYKNGKWQALVRHKGLPSLSRTFLKKADAIRWSQQAEVEVDRHGIGPDRSLLSRMTLADLVKRFRDEVCPHRKGMAKEVIMLNAFLRSDLADKRLADVGPQGFGGPL